MISGCPVQARTHWFEIITAALGDDFVVLSADCLLEMRLVVAVKQGATQAMVRSVEVRVIIPGIRPLPPCAVGALT